MPLEELFFEIGMILVVAAGLSLLVHRLGQPLIIAYILTGILVGPGVFGLAQATDFFGVLSQIGIAFLLFTVGLGLNWRSVKDVGGIALATGFGQVLFTSLIGFAIVVQLGFDVVTSLYLAVAISFSSTIIIVKLLMDKEELDSLYGRISVGFLLVQDFIAMFILLALGAISGGATLTNVVTQTVLKIVVAVPVLWFISAKIVPPIVRYAARSQELLFIYAIAWCFLVAGALVWAGFGMELGALMAGVTLSGTQYHREINARIRPVRDFFLVIFFIVLGTQLGFEGSAHLLWPTLALSAFVLVGNPVIVMLIMRALGYHPRTGFMAGTTVAQISEFSFIVLAAGIAVGHIGQSVLVLATAVGLVTIAASSYLIEHNEWVYDRLAPLLRFLEPKEMRNAHASKRKTPDAVLFGYEMMSRQLIDVVRGFGEYLIVDFDPQVVRSLAQTGEPIIYGDAGDDNFLIELGVENARLVVSTIPDSSVSFELLRFLRSHAFAGVVIVSVHNEQEAELCYGAGATYVIIPSVMSGERLRELLVQKRTRKASWKALAASRRPLSA